MKKITTLIIIFFTSIFFISCTCEIKEVYVPTKCNTPEHKKPKREENEDFTEFQAKLRAYYKAIENDLNFCRTGQRIQKPP